MENNVRKVLRSVDPDQIAGHFMLGHSRCTRRKSFPTPRQQGTIAPLHPSLTQASKSQFWYNMLRLRRKLIDFLQWPKRQLPRSAAGRTMKAVLISPNHRHQPHRHEFGHPEDLLHAL